MKRIIIFTLLLATHTTYATSSSVDINSYTFPAGKVNQSTCLYSEPSFSSVCLEYLDNLSVLSSSQETRGSFIKTSTSKMNPNRRCDFSQGRFYCTGGEAFIRTNGWVFNEHFEDIRYKKSCDDFDEISVYLERPSIYCTDSYCTIDVRYSSAPDAIKVSAEITTYDKRNRYLGREDNNETDFAPYGSTGLTIWINDEVEKVVLTDVSCEKW